MNLRNELQTRSVPNGEILRNPADPRVLEFFLGTIKIFLHPTLVFETGAEEEIIQHKEAGGNSCLLMTHFERIGPGHLGSATQRHEALSHFPGTTGVTARRELGSVPVLGYFISKAGVEWVDRGSEHEDETPEEKTTRQTGNREAISVGARYIAAGGNWVMWPEGRTKIKVPTINGEFKKIPRRPGELLPVRDGIAEILGLLTPEQRHNLRLIGIAEHFGPRLLRSLRPTLGFTRPEMPAEGTKEDWLQQAESLMQRALDLAIRHDAARAWHKKYGKYLSGQR